MGKCEIKDLNQQLSEKQSKIIENFFSSKLFNSFVCMYKMVDNSAETSNKAEASIIKIRENDSVNKTLFKLRCISDSKKDGVVKIFLISSIMKLKENTGLKT